MKKFVAVHGGVYTRLRIFGLAWDISYALPHAAGGNVGKETP